ncbi:MAG: hypothetical protein IPN85_05110 [Flavobacteriales bacterium]|nr:hypothetical protein [Flavobacteriales bacterium]
MHIAPTGRREGDSVEALAEGDGLDRVDGTETTFQFIVAGVRIRSAVGRRCPYVQPVRTGDQGRSGQEHVGGGAGGQQAGQV